MPQYHLLLAQGDHHTRSSSVCWWGPRLKETMRTWGGHRATVAEISKRRQTGERHSYYFRQGNKTMGFSFPVLYSRIYNCFLLNHVLSPQTPDHWVTWWWWWILVSQHTSWQSRELLDLLPFSDSVQELSHHSGIPVPPGISPRQQARPTSLFQQVSEVCPCSRPLHVDGTLFCQTTNYSPLDQVFYWIISFSYQFVGSLCIVAILTFSLKGIKIFPSLSSVFWLCVWHLYTYERPICGIYTYIHICAYTRTHTHSCTLHT